MSTAARHHAPPGASPIATPGKPLRRCLLQAAVAAAALGPLAPARSLPARWLQDDASIWRRPRALWVTRPQAQEAVRVVYWADGIVEPAGHATLNHLYRDLSANAQHPIALGLLDLNFALQMAVWRWFGPRPLVLFSGYRTAATNARIGGTEPSVHALGIADDFHYEGLSLNDNLRLARRYQVGGLGFYPDRGSLHKDIGRLRSWVTPGRHAESGREHASFR